MSPRDRLAQCAKFVRAGGPLNITRREEFAADCEAAVAAFDQVAKPRAPTADLVDQAIKRSAMQHPICSLSANDRMVNIVEHVLALVDTGWTKPEDPDLIAARKIVASRCTMQATAERYLSGALDETGTIEMVLLGIQQGRQAAAA